MNTDLKPLFIKTLQWMVTGCITGFKVVLIVIDRTTNCGTWFCSDLSAIRLILWFYIDRNIAVSSVRLRLYISHTMVHLFSRRSWVVTSPQARWVGLNVALLNIITWLCDILALVWHFGPACVTFRPGLCDILALSCVTKASACHHTPILTTGAVYRKFHRSSVSKTT